MKNQINKGVSKLLIALLSLVIMSMTCMPFAACQKENAEESVMETIKFDLNEKGEKFKILNATNGGPWYKRHSTDQYRSNFEAYKAARIPYSRNHDSNLSGSTYGGPYAHDISAIFPNFDADVNDPASYDFACTDESILATLEAGTETYFRLGQSIEHQIKKHNTMPPKDFRKWAEICEHIIRHYNEGWADGYELNIKYWEIWNEPDLDGDGSPNKRNWGGTKAQFFDFYETVAKHLKERFPDLKIGGPALAWNEEWAEEFLRTMYIRKVKIDFFSWHVYCTSPKPMIEKAERIRKLLDTYGYDKTESILNEWNYIKGWKEDYVYSLKAIHGMKGAAFTMACMSAAQDSSIDMLMYYDTRPSAFCGAFDFYSYEPLKGYYPLYWYGMFYDMDHEVKCAARPKNVYTLCGVDENGKSLAVITYYTDDDSAADKAIAADFGKDGKYEIYLLDEDNDGKLVKVTSDLYFIMRHNSCIMIKEI